MADTVDMQTSTVGSGEELVTYDVRGDLASGPPLFLFGSPMDAVGFGSLAARFTDRPVVTYDPRGGGRNPTGTSEVTPEQHAEDLHRVISALGVGPVDAFGSSGGATNGLALLAAYPDDVRRFVGHEPPVTAYLPDRAEAVAAARRMKEVYLADGLGPAMARFFGLLMTSGELPPGFADQPTPDPAQFGLPTEDDGDRTNLLFRNMPGGLEYEVVDSLRALGDRVVIGVGADSHDELAARGARSVAAHLGVRLVEFPGGHGGFSGGEYGQPAGDPDGFAATLREVLA
jgi:pimeloyl-ACP methyl ester carboxylesterase